MILNFSNQTGAGPKNISLNFIEQILLRQDRYRFIVIVPHSFELYGSRFGDGITVIHTPRFVEWLGGFARLLFVQMYLIPEIVARTNTASILHFGNFCLMRHKGVQQNVLLHHPYLVDDQLFRSLSLSKKPGEWIKRKLFSRSVSVADKMIVQAPFMQKSFQKRFANSRVDLCIIPNPISENLLSQTDPPTPVNRLRNYDGTRSLKILYPSRYYPHKNHIFLISVARELRKRRLDFEIFVTVDTKIEAGAAFLMSAKSAGVPITNLGEINQGKLIDYYKKSDLCLFPSEAETFGNPLIEAAYFLLPVIGPDRDYLNSVLTGCAETYPPGDAALCADLIFRAARDRDFYVRMTEAFHAFQPSILDPTCWVERYLDIA